MNRRSFLKTIGISVAVAPLVGLAAQHEPMKWRELSGDELKRACNTRPGTKYIMPTADETSEPLYLSHKCERQVRALPWNVGKKECTALGLRVVFVRPIAL